MESCWRVQLVGHSDRFKNKSNAVVAKLATTALDGKIYQVDSGAYVHKNGISCTYLAKYI